MEPTQRHEVTLRDDAGSRTRRSETAVSGVGIGWAGLWIGLGIAATNDTFLAIVFGVRP